ncbi:MAG: hypothetical protein EP340_01350 [Alphaproteobacteria bacterium]|nr:MAG: hypothetical protein EP340_01350 [Alphaproteobacteria bacterium]
MRPRVLFSGIVLLGILLVTPLSLAYAQLQVDPRIGPSTSLTTQQPARFDANGNPILSDIVQQEIRTQGGTKVPVLIPYIWTRDANAIEASGFRIKIEGENYTAIFRPENTTEPIDIVIDGTLEVVKSRGRPARRAASALPYSSLGELRGGSITFRRNGASYLVQFICRGDKPMDAPSCVEEENARAFVTYHLTGDMQ